MHRHPVFPRVLCALGLACLSSLSQATLSVFACEPEWAALTAELAGAHASVFSATHAGQDPHHVQARPSLIARLRSADLAVCTGAELEVGWMPLLQRRARNPKVLAGSRGYLEAARQVALLEIPDTLDRADGDIHGDGNPHIQLDPRRLLQVAAALSVRLQAIDPGNARDYQQRLRDFSERWQAAMQEWQRRAAPLRGRRAIVHHREWVYLLDWLGMQRAGSLEPKPGIPPTPGHLAQLKDLAADMILVSPLNDQRPADWLHQQTGLPVVVVPHTVDATPAASDLFQLFDEIVRQLTANRA